MSTYLDQLKAERTYLAGYAICDPNSDRAIGYALDARADKLNDMIDAEITKTKKEAPPPRSRDWGDPMTAFQDLCAQALHCIETPGDFTADEQEWLEQDLADAMNRQL